MANEREIRRLLDQIAKDDDEQAFRRFFNLYYSNLLNFAHYLLESIEGAEEVVSSVFTNIWINRNKLPHIKNINSYLFSSVKNHSLNYIRDNKNALKLLSLDAENEIFTLELTNPEKELITGELYQKTFKAIDDLPPKCKMIFTLVREDGLKYKEVAELLDISVKTVEVQMGRALSKIRATLNLYLQK